MQIQTNLHAGMTFQECDAARNWYKNQVKTNSCQGLYPGPMPGPLPGPIPGPMPGPVPNPTPDDPVFGACSESWDMGVCTKTCPYPPFNMPC